MDILKELKHAYKCDTYTELAEFLDVNPQTLRQWKCYGVPERRKTSLTIILNQQKQLNKQED